MQATRPIDTVIHTRDASTSDESREQDSFSFHLEASINPLLDSNRIQGLIGLIGFNTELRQSIIFLSCK